MAGQWKAAIWIHDDEGVRIHLIEVGIESDRVPLPRRYSLQNDNSLLEMRKLTQRM